MEMVVADKKNSEVVGAGDTSTVSEDRMAELMKKLNLTAEEASAVILEDENEEDFVSLGWAIIGKVLSPTILHVDTIMAALRPAWGNPKGMSARSVGDNTFIVEFATKVDKDRVEAGSPWTVGKHAVIINNFNARQRPSDVCFDKLTLWARIKNPRFERMNRHWGEQLGAKLGKVESVDVDSQGRAWGNCLRVRVTVDIPKPLIRCITAYSKKYDEFDTYDVVYEKLLHYCFSCGLLGHSSMECPTPAERNEEGKLPWNADKLCFKDEKKRSFSASKSTQSSQSSGRSSYFDDKKGVSQFSPKAKAAEPKVNGVESQDEFTSPMELKVQNLKLKNKVEQCTSCMELSPSQDLASRVAGQKRKQIKVYRPKGTTTDTGEKVTLDNSQAIVMAGNNLKPCESGPALSPTNEEQCGDSYKKQKKELTLISLGSADQAEAAMEQPRHTQ